MWNRYSVFLNPLLTIRGIDGWILKTERPSSKPYVGKPPVVFYGYIKDRHQEVGAILVVSRYIGD